MNPQNIKSIYIIAICGTGMASLAGLLKGSGYEVTGSDTSIYPPMSTLLEQMEISIKPGYRKENIAGDIDLVVVGNAVSKDNEEVLAVQEAGIPYISFPQALARFFLEGRKSLVVTGTHGKTTTTSLLSWVFHATGQNPGFMVGGWLKNFDTNHRVPQGDYFITEGDEYDTAFFDKGPKFLHYQPFAAILTGIEFDHADIFDNLDQIKSAFRKFVNLVDPEGFLLVAFSDENTKDVLESASCEIETYGFSPQADWSVSDYRFEGGHGTFTLNHKGKETGQFRLPMIGRHNVLNTAAVAAVAIKCGVAADKVAKALEGFQGIKRRQEVVGIKNEVTVIDDFAHHPTAIHLTLEAVREAWPDSRIWAVFEPRSATSRRKTFQDQLPESFRLADRTLISSLFAPEKLAAEERLDPEQVVKTIQEKGGEAWFFQGADPIVNFIVEQQQPGDVVLVMSSGGFDGIHQKLLDRL
jgi:UDP-N-acetylmuramate: L-alanyl-gamma-D-glutamyl-meso-diaminopimelate ligase